MNKLESPGSKDDPCKTSLHSGKWFMIRRFVKVFALYTYIKRCPVMTTGLYLNNVESPGPKDVPHQTSMHSGKWLTRRIFLKLFAI